MVGHPLWAGHYSKLGEIIVNKMDKNVGFLVLVLGDVQTINK